jgi:predicted ATPase
MIRAFELSGFQSYREPARVELDDHITFLAGRNDVGKSALLRALRLFVERQSGATSDARFTFECEISAEELNAAIPSPEPGMGDGHAVRRTEITTRPTHTVVAEFVPAGLAGTTIEAGQLQPVRLEFVEAGLRARGLPGHTIGWEGSWSSTGATLTNEFLDVVRRRIATVTFITPRQIVQGPRPLAPNPRLAPNAGNLAEVLLFLYLNERLNVFARVEQFIVEAFPQIRGVAVPQDPSQIGQMYGEPMITYRHSDEMIPLRDCGSGVEQMLALAVAVLTTTEPRVVLIDEPQAYLHPHAERSLLALLREQDEHQYVIATHSHQLLAAYPLSHARLVTIDGGRTRIAAPSQPADVLDDLGVTAADLWLNDHVLWVEGPSEEVIFEVLLGADAHRGVEVRRIPQGASRLAARSPKKTAQFYEFCQGVSAAVAPLPVKMRFLFDRDEKDDAFREAVKVASADRADFLGVREIENLFLDTDLIWAVVHDRCIELGLEPPTCDAVRERLKELLGADENRDLYPDGLPDAAVPQEVVKGSAVLGALFWEYLTSEYRKVEDGEVFAVRAKTDRSQLLDPLVSVLRRLMDDPGYEPADLRDDTARGTRTSRL